MTATVRHGIEKLGAVDIAYDVRGSGPPLLLVSGFGMTRTMWSDAVCELLVREGLTVVRMDNRDTGASTRLSDRAPALRGSLLRSFLGVPLHVPYTLSDMANDALGLMSALGHERFHLVGASMGGMIAQTAAIEHGARLRTMTSIMSTPGGRRYSFASLRALGALLTPMPIDPEKQPAHMMKLFEILNGDMLPFEKDSMRALVESHLASKPTVAGSLRHMSAILEAGGRRLSLLRGVTTPTLVIHGSADPLLPVRGGRATARLIPGARFLLIDGMGHNFHSSVIRQLTRAIGDHARENQA